MNRKTVLNVFVAFLVFQIIILAPSGIRDLIRWENRVLGGSYFTGFLMIIIAVITIIVNRHELHFMGVSLDTWRISVNMGFKAWLFFLVPQIVLIVLNVVGFRIQNHLNLSLLLSFLVLCVGYFYVRSEKITPASNFKLFLIIFLLITPLIMSYLFDASSVRLFKQFGWDIVVGGFVEEFFYRGFIQSSINLEYGKVWRIGETRFGLGLIISAIFYGFSRGLRNFKPWIGVYTISWSLTIYTFTLGIFYGFIREKSDDIVSSGTASSMINAISNLLIRVLS